MGWRWGDSSGTGADKADPTGGQSLRVSLWPASQARLTPALLTFGDWHNGKLRAAGPHSGSRFLTPHTAPSPPQSLPWELSSPPRCYRRHSVRPGGSAQRPRRKAFQRAGLGGLMMFGLSKALVIISHFSKPISNMANSSTRPRGSNCHWRLTKRDDWIASSAGRQSAGQRSRCPHPDRLGVNHFSSRKQLSCHPPAIRLFARLTSFHLATAVGNSL